MIRFVLHKLLNKKWMTLSLLLGNILLLSLAVATPVYTDASLQRTLDLKFNEIIRENNEMPLRLRVQSPAVRGSEDINGSIRKMSERIALTGDDLRLPVQLVRTYFYLPSYEGTSDFPRKESRTKLQLASLSDLPAHVTIRGDEALFGERNADGSVNAYLPEQSLQKTRLTYGEILSFEDLKTPDGEALKVRIAGSFTMKDTEDPYWIDSPASASYRSRLFIDEGLFSSLFLEGRNDTRVSAVWNVLYDHTGFDAGEVERTLEVSRTLAKYIQNEYRFSASFNFSAWFSDFIHMEKQIRTTYLVLQIPVFALLVLFIFMVAGRIVDNEEAEIAVLNSRGVSKAQILMIYLVEGLILVLFAGAAAFFLSLPLVRLLLSSNGFLEFIIRKDLKLSLSVRSFVYAGAAALAAILSMLIPALRFSGRSVTRQKEEKRSAMRRIPFWHRYFLDLVLLAVSLYGLYSFSGREEVLAAEVMAGKSLDPLLFLSTVLFMAGAGLFLLRVTPLLERLLFAAFKKRWSPALFASHRQILGTRREQGFVMIFLAMTVATGIFNAAAARTIRENDEENLSYLTGADLVVQENWRNNSVSLQQRAEEGDEEAARLPVTYYEPDYGKYETVPGFSSVTKVSRQSGSIGAEGVPEDAVNIQIMAIEPKKFGETAEFDEKLMTVHWYDFLNALSMREDCVLLSSNYKAFGLKAGDRVTLRTDLKNQNTSLDLMIAGFVDYWPGYSPNTMEIMEDSSVRKEEQYLAVIRLDTMQRAWSVLPYEIWMKTSEGRTDAFYTFAEERSIPLRKVKDRAALIQAEASSAIKQGTSGIFTVSFLLSLLLCTVGFLIYWVSSVKNRELQFGVLRAMGMRFREIITMLLNEQFFVSVSSIASGYLVGFLAAKLYMPLLRIAYSSAEYPVPLSLVREPADEYRLFAVILLMLLFGILIIAGMIRRMKISEALKLGED